MLFTSLSYPFNKHWIFADGYLEVVYAIKRHSELLLLLDELLGPVLADASVVAL